MRVPHPHCRGKDAVILDVVTEQVLILRGKRVVGLYLDITQLFPKRNAAGAKIVFVREFVDLTHERARVKTKVVLTLLELVQLFDDGNWNHNVIVLKLFHGIEVVEDDVCV